MYSKSKTVLIFCIALLITTMTLAQGTTDLTIKGKLTGSNGKPMVKALIYVFDDAMSFYSGTTPTPVGADGSFEIKLKKSGMYSITFTGLGHGSFMISVPAFETKGVSEVEVKLAAAKPLLKKNSTGFRSNAEADFFVPSMVQLSPDGKFRYKVNKKLDTLLVQIVPKAYFMSTGFEYPGASYLADSTGGFHTAFFNVKPGFEIVLDPATLPKVTGYNSSEIKFISDPADLKTIYMAADKQSIEFREDNKRLFDYYFDLFKNSKNKIARDFAAMKLYEFNTQPDYPVLENIDEVMAAITPENAGWSRSFYGNRDIIESMEKEQQVKYLEKMFDYHGDDVKSYILYYFKEKPGIVSAEKYKEFYEKFKKTVTDEKYAYAINDLKPPVPMGEQKLLDFTVKMIDGKDFSPKQLSGKYFLIDFWGTWCMPCLAEIPAIEKAYSKYKAKGFEIISLAFGSPEEDFKNLRKTNPMPWLHALLSDADAENIGTLYNVEFIPKMLLVSPEGKIIANEETLRDGGLEKKLAEIYK